MTAVSLDATDRRLIAALQADGRASYAELAKTVSMSASAVTERIRRLEESGVIAGYSAIIDADRLGLEVLAFIRLRYPTNNYKPFHDLVAVTPEIVEAHHVTGEDCFVLKVVARSMRHLETVAGRVAGLGSVTTTIAYSSPLPRRAILPYPGVSDPGVPDPGVLAGPAGDGSGLPSSSKHVRTS